MQYKVETTAMIVNLVQSNLSVDIYKYKTSLV